MHFHRLQLIILSLAFIPLCHIHAQFNWIPLPGLGTVPTTTTTTTTTTTMAPEPEPGDVFNEQFQTSQNARRVIHGAVPLTFNSVLQAEAKRCADAYAAGTITGTATCLPTGDYFEQWAPTEAVPLLPDLKSLAADLVEYWYMEYTRFDFSDPQYLPTTRHFTQMVWNETTEFGCAVSAETTMNTYYVFCVYNPPGNIETVVGSQGCIDSPTTNLRANVAGPTGPLRNKQIHTLFH